MFSKNPGRNRENFDTFDFLVILIKMDFTLSLIEKNGTGPDLHFQRHQVCKEMRKIKLTEISTFRFVKFIMGQSL